MGKRAITKRPKRVVGDAAYTLVKAVVSAVPGFGGAAAELLSAIIIPPVTKRRDEWMESIAKGLEELEAKYEGFKVESLSENDVFITTIMQATQAAIRNHQKEKLQALRNAVLNSALANAPEEDVQIMFLAFVDTLTTWHLRILRFFVGRPGPYIGSESEVIHSPLDPLEDAFPQLKGRHDFYGWVVRDLRAKELITTEVMDEFVELRTTDLGEKFLRFIAFPIRTSDT